jgi:DNA glycosylase AlkZ-like
MLLEDRPAARPSGFKCQVRRPVRVGSIQFDPIAVAGRSHDLVLHARVADYEPAWCDLLYERREIFEAYSVSSHPIWCPARSRNTFLWLQSRRGFGAWVGTVVLLLAMGRLRGRPSWHPIWVGLSVATLGIWTVATILAITLPVIETGTDPTRVPVAAIVAPIAGAMLTALAGTVANVFRAGPGGH